MESNQFDRLLADAAKKALKEVIESYASEISQEVREQRAVNRKVERIYRYFRYRPKPDVNIGWRKITKQQDSDGMIVLNIYVLRAIFEKILHPRGISRVEGAIAVRIIKILKENGITDEPLLCVELYAGEANLAVRPKKKEDPYELSELKFDSPDSVVMPTSVEDEEEVPAEAIRVANDNSTETNLPFEIVTPRKRKQSWIARLIKHWLG